MLAAYNRHDAEESDVCLQSILQAVDNGSTSLNLNFNSEIEELPAEVRMLREQLECLHIDNNYCVTALPPFVGDLHRLRWLNASYCHISRVAPQVCRLSKLERLFLSNNDISFLPSEMWQLKALEELRVDNNKLRVLPGGLLFLTRLRAVALENNPLYDPVEINGANAVSLVPSQPSIDCANCCVRVRNYVVSISFHSLAEHRELPFVFFTCSDVCLGHLRDRLAKHDVEHAPRGDHS